MTDLSFTQALDSKTVLDSIDKCMQNRENQYAVTLAEEYLASAEESSPQEAFNQFTCRRKMADALYQLKAFEKCLEQYEECHVLAEKYVGVCAIESMEVLFQVEKTLNALAMLEKIGDVESELKGALVSQYLMQSDRATKDPSVVVDSEVETELLENLWSASLEKLEKPEPIPVKQKPDWLQKLEELANNKEVSAIQLQLGIWSASILALALIVQGIQFMLSMNLRGEFEPDHEIQQQYVQSTTNTAGESLSLKSTDGSEKLVLKPNAVATLITGNEAISANIIFYDGTFWPKLMTIAYSNIEPTSVFHCRGCSIVGPTGSVFFDDKSSDYKLVKEMDTLADRMNKNLSEGASLTDNLSAPENHTEDPADGKPQLGAVPNVEGKQSEESRVPPTEPIKLSDPSDDNAGAIVLDATKNDPSAFKLTGFYSKGKSFGAVRGKDGWHSIFPSSDSQSAVAKGSLFLFCEQEIDASTAFWQKNLFLVLFVLLVCFVAMGVGAKVFIDRRSSKMMIENAAMKIRAK